MRVFGGAPVAGVVAGVLVGLFVCGEVVAAPMEAKQRAIFRGLDKVAARVEVVEGEVGSPVRVGILDVLVRACYVSAAEDSPEAASYVEIFVRRGEEAKRVFNGWMFASSPALHSLEHPAYDVWLVGCK